MNNPGRNELRATLQKVEALLNNAKNNIEQIRQRGQSREYVEDAYSTCDQMGRSLGECLKPLIVNVKKSIDGNSSTETIIINIDNVLAEVENVRLQL